MRRVRGAMGRFLVYRALAKDGRVVWRPLTFVTTRGRLVYNLMGAGVPRNVAEQAVVDSGTIGRFLVYQEMGAHRIVRSEHAEAESSTPVRKKRGFGLPQVCISGLQIFSEKSPKLPSVGVRGSRDIGG